MDMGAKHSVLGEISVSHGGEYEDVCLLDCCALMMEAASTSETSVNFYQATRRNNPEDSHLHDVITLRRAGSYKRFEANNSGKCLDLRKKEQGI
jgi:hypothetical protein